MQVLCPRCGEPSEEGLCDRCILQSTKLLSSPEQVEVTLCSVCGSKRLRGRWQIIESSIEELVTEAAYDSICIHKDLADPKVEIELRKIGATRYLATISWRGNFKGRLVEERCQLPVRIRFVACERCSRMAGRYFEAVVQVRGNSQPPTELELEECKSIAFSMTDAGYRSGDRLSFIQEIKTTKGGMDIVLGSTQLGRQMARAVFERFGGRLQESGKLAGRRDGRDLYRTTILVRLPRLKKGDIVSLRGSLFEVTGFDGRRTLLASLEGVRRSSLTEERAEGVEVLGNRADSRKAIVIAKDEDVLEVMDPESYKIVFASKPLNLDIDPGQEVNVIRTVRGLIVLE